MFFSKHNKDFSNRSNKKLNKKAYFFIIDAFVGSAIIFLSLLMIFSSHSNTPKMDYNYQIAEDYSTFMMNTRLEDLNNEYLNYLIDQNMTVNKKNTIMEQVTEFYYNAYYVCPGAPCNTSNLSLAKNLIQNISDPLIPKKYGFSYIIKDSTDSANTRNITIYSRNITSMSESKSVIASKKIIFLQVNSTTLFGPQLTEIKIWI